MVYNISWSTTVPVFTDGDNGCKLTYSSFPNIADPEIIQNSNNGATVTVYGKTSLTVKCKIVSSGLYISNTIVPFLNPLPTSVTLSVYPLLPRQVGTSEPAAGEKFTLTWSALNTTSGTCGIYKDGTTPDKAISNTDLDNSGSFDVNIPTNGGNTFYAICSNRAYKDTSGNLSPKVVQSTATKIVPNKLVTSLKTQGVADKDTGKITLVWTSKDGLNPAYTPNDGNISCALSVPAGSATPDPGVNGKKNEDTALIYPPEVNTAYTVTCTSLGDGRSNDTSSVVTGVRPEITNVDFKFESMDADGNLTGVLSWTSIVTKDDSFILTGIPDFGGPIAPLGTNSTQRVTFNTRTVFTLFGLSTDGRHNVTKDFTVDPADYKLDIRLSAEQDVSDKGAKDGSSSKLTWYIQNAKNPSSTTCTASSVEYPSDWTGDKLTSGSQIISITRDGTFTLTCTDNITGVSNHSDLKIQAVTASVKDDSFKITENKINKTFDVSFKPVNASYCTLYFLPLISHFNTGDTDINFDADEDDSSSVTFGVKDDKGIYTHKSGFNDVDQFLSIPMNLIKIETELDLNCYNEVTKNNAAKTIFNISPDLILGDAIPTVDTNASNSSSITYNIHWNVTSQTPDDKQPNVYPISPIPDHCQLLAQTDMATDAPGAIDTSVSDWSDYNYKTFKTNGANDPDTGITYIDKSVKITKTTKLFIKCFNTNTGKDFTKSVTLDFAPVKATLTITPDPDQTNHPGIYIFNYECSNMGSGGTVNRVSSGAGDDYWDKTKYAYDGSVSLTFKPLRSSYTLLCMNNEKGTSDMVTIPVNNNVMDMVLHSTIDPTNASGISDPSTNYFNVSNTLGYINIPFDPTNNSLFKVGWNVFNCHNDGNLSTHQDNVSSVCKDEIFSMYKSYVSNDASIVQPQTLIDDSVLVKGDYTGLTPTFKIGTYTFTAKTSPKGIDLKNERKIEVKVVPNQVEGYILAQTGTSAFGQLRQSSQNNPSLTVLVGDQIDLKFVLNHCQDASGNNTSGGQLGPNNESFSDCDDATFDLTSDNGGLNQVPGYSKAGYILSNVGYGRRYSLLPNHLKLTFSDSDIPSGQNSKDFTYTITSSSYELTKLKYSTTVTLHLVKASKPMILSGDGNYNVGTPANNNSLMDYIPLNQALLTGWNNAIVNSDHPDNSANPYWIFANPIGGAASGGGLVVDNNIRMLGGQIYFYPSPAVYPCSSIFSQDQCDPNSRNSIYGWLTDSRFTVNVSVDGNTPIKAKVRLAPMHLTGFGVTRKLTTNDEIAVVLGPLSVNIIPCKISVDTCRQVAITNFGNDMVTDLQYPAQFVDVNGPHTITFSPASDSQLQFLPLTAHFNTGLVGADVELSANGSNLYDGTKLSVNTSYDDTNNSVTLNTIKASTLKITWDWKTCKDKISGQPILIDYCQFMGTGTHTILRDGGNGVQFSVPASFNEAGYVTTDVMKVWGVGSHSYSISPYYITPNNGDLTLAGFSADELLGFKTKSLTVNVSDNPPVAVDSFELYDGANKLTRVDEDSIGNPGKIFDINVDPNKTYKLSWNSIAKDCKIYVEDRWVTGSSLNGSYSLVFSAAGSLAGANANVETLTVKCTQTASGIQASSLYTIKLVPMSITSRSLTDISTNIDLAKNGMTQVWVHSGDSAKFAWTSSPNIKKCVVGGFDNYSIGDMGANDSVQLLFNQDKTLNITLTCSDINGQSVSITPITIKFYQTAGPIVNLHLYQSIGGLPVGVFDTQYVDSNGPFNAAFVTADVAQIKPYVISWDTKNVPLNGCNIGLNPSMYTGSDAINKVIPFLGLSMPVNSNSFINNVFFTKKETIRLVLSCIGVDGSIKNSVLKIVVSDPLTGGSTTNTTTGTGSGQSSQGQ